MADSENTSLARLIREMPGKNRCDLTPLLGDGVAFHHLADALAEPFRGCDITRVVAVDAIGFALGGAVAHVLGVGLALARKSGKVAWNVETATFVDYTGRRKGLEIAADAVAAGDRVLVVDDWAEAGAQLEATIELVERLGGSVVGASLINVDARARAPP